VIDGELVERARGADLKATAESLGARLKRVSATELAGPCPRHAGRDRFSINVRKQLWNCRGSEGGNDSISLASHVLGLNFRAVIRFLTGEDAPQKTTPLVAKTVAKPAAPDAFVERLVDAIVAEVGPVRSTPGEAYLREARKIDTEAIADVLERTDAIGWHPSVLFREEGHPLHERKLGAIIGIMTDPITAKPTGAISRTYLGPDGAKAGKAKTLGAPAGLIRLSRDEDVLLGLHLAEGMESALVALAKGFRPAWACGSASIMAAFPVLASIETLTLFADNDASGTGQRAANQAAARWLSAGREARVYLRKAPGDLNDASREADE
jgi:hypothetical protein